MEFNIDLENRCIKIDGEIFFLVSADESTIALMDAYAKGRDKNREELKKSKGKSVFDNEKINARIKELESQPTTNKEVEDNFRHEKIGDYTFHIRKSDEKMLNELVKPKTETTNKDYEIEKAKVKLQGIIHPLEISDYKKNELLNAVENLYHLKKEIKSESPTKDYEILTSYDSNGVGLHAYHALKCEYNKCKINSVKRLSDGSEFYIGQKVQRNGCPVYIVEFKEHKPMVGGLKIKLGNNITTNLKMIDLLSPKKSKPSPILTTEDYPKCDVKNMKVLIDFLIEVHNSPDFTPDEREKIKNLFITFQTK